MKILSKQDVSQWTYVHVCSTCESKLEVEAKDLSHHHYDGDMREPSYDSYSASCPVCHTSFNITEKNIPKLIQVETKAKSARSTSDYFKDR